MTIPYREAFPFVIAENTIAVPINVPEDNSTWTDVADIQDIDLPDGTYILSGGVTYTPTSTSKSSLFRTVIDGVAGIAISLESKDTSDVAYIPFRTYFNVSDGTVDIQVQAQCEEGQGGGGINIQHTLLDYERKLTDLTP